MSAPPTRCCVRTLKGDRCQNDVSPTRGWTMIGPVRLAACGLSGHQTALRNLPAFVRHDAYCGAVGCDRPSAAGICPMHRDMYRDFGITEHMLLQEPAAMPTTEAQPTPPAAPKEEATKEHDYCRPGCGHDNEPAAPTAPGPTVAELEAELERERARADAAERDAVAERERADEALQDLQELQDMRSSTRAELHAVCLLMQRLGSYGADASAMLMRLLPVESRRALLEIEVADARAELARDRANVVYPPTPERLAEVSARIAALDARIAALDAG